MNRPEGITLSALWFFLLAACCVFGLGGIAIGMIGLWTSPGAQGILMSTMGMMLGLLAVVTTGVCFAVTGWGLWTLKPWARGAAILLAALQLILVPFGTVAGILILFYLGRNQRAKAAFGLAPRAPAP